MFQTFGNTVKIKQSPDTQKHQLAGRIGEIYGDTTPSKTGVEVIGKPQFDYAVNVYFKDLETSFWFDEELLETISTGEGSIMTIGTASFIKTEKGEWVSMKKQDEINITPNKKKKWWHFWK